MGTQHKKIAKQLPIDKSRSLESQAIYAGAIAFAMALIVSFVFFYGSDSPFFGRGSIGLAAGVLGVIAILTVYLVAAASVREPAERTKLQRLRLYTTTGALALMHVAVGFLLLAGMFYVLQDAFQGVLLDHYASSVIVASVVAAAAYVTYLAAAQMTSMRLSMVLAIFLVAGALTSMMSAENPYWWQDHFSSLGAGSGMSSYAFNLTLIIGGIVIVGLSDYIAEDFVLIKQKSDAHSAIKAHVVSIMLALIGVCLALVGYFVYDTHPILHNNAAGGMAVLFIILILLLPWLVPIFSRAFFGFSYVIMAVLLFCLWLMNGVGYFNLTTFELMAAALIFTWLVVFIRQVGAALEDDIATRSRSRA